MAPDLKTPRERPTAADLREVVDRELALLEPDVRRDAERSRVMPAPGGPEPLGRVAFSPDDASPSRARLGRVAAMIADAERATPAGGRTRHQHAVVVPLLPRRRRLTLPRPRAAERPDLTAVAQHG